MKAVLDMAICDVESESFATAQTRPSCIACLPIMANECAWGKNWMRLVLDWSAELRPPKVSVSSVNA